MSEMLAATARLAVRDLVVTFGHGGGMRTVLHGVSTQIAPGRAVGIVGESGSGKSTLAKAIVGMVTPVSGEILLDDVPLAEERRRRRLETLRRVQYIPQDPYSSLNPRKTVGDALAEALDPLRPRPRRQRDRIVHWLETVRLPADAIDRYPHEFSGGQRQRIAIARGLLVEPELIIADEITSALDVSVQAEVLELLARLRGELGLTMAFISHNLAVVQRLCDDVVVLYHGRVVEQGPTARIYSEPAASYTRLLLESVPEAPGFTLDTPYGSEIPE